MVPPVQVLVHIRPTFNYQPTFGDVGFHVDFSIHFHLVWPQTTQM
jgi:hypothetical protein